MTIILSLKRSQIIKRNQQWQKTLPETQRSCVDSLRQAEFASLLAEIRLLQ